jgi:hypothetical protein
MAQEKPLTAGIVLSDHEKKDLKEVIIILNESEGIEFLNLHQNFIYFSYDTESNRLAAMTQLFNRSYTVKQDNGLPLDFPIMPNSESEEEINAYAQQKSEWIEANPQRYQTAQEQTGTIAISQQEFELLPPDKQEHILSHPDVYIILP